jgi:hypothetical protein
MKNETVQMLWVLGNGLLELLSFPFIVAVATFLLLKKRLK